MGADQAYLAGGGEPFAAEDASSDGEPVSGQRRIARVGEMAIGAVEHAADVGTQEAHLAGGGEPLAAEHAAVNAELVGNEGAAVRVGELAPCAVELATDVGAG